MYTSVADNQYCRIEGGSRKELSRNVVYIINDALRNKTRRNKFFHCRDSPSDTLTNFRDEVCDVLETFGIKTKAHHHEVATAGQSEIVLSHMGLTEMADAFITGVKTIREIASKREMIASFNPKPIPNDNGSAAHINQSLWKTKNKKNYNVFYDPSDKYAELSQTAHYYIGSGWPS